MESLESILHFWENVIEQIPIDTHEYNSRELPDDFDITEDLVMYQETNVFEREVREDTLPPASTSTEWPPEVGEIALYVQRNLQQRLNISSKYLIVTVTDIDKEYVKDNPDEPVISIQMPDGQEKKTTLNKLLPYNEENKRKYYQVETTGDEIVKSEALPLFPTDDRHSHPYFGNQKDRSIIHLNKRTILQIIEGIKEKIKFKPYSKYFSPICNAINDKEYLKVIEIFSQPIPSPECNLPKSKCRADICKLTKSGNCISKRWTPYHFNLVINNDKPQNNHTLLQYCCKKFSSEIQNPTHFFKDISVRTPLKFLNEELFDLFTLITELISRGSDVNKKMSYALVPQTEFTLLHIVKYNELIKVLLENDADINIRDNKHQLPLYINDELVSFISRNDELLEKFKKEYINFKLHKAIKYEMTCQQTQTYRVLEDTNTITRLIENEKEFIDIHMPTGYENGISMLNLIVNSHTLKMRSFYRDSKDHDRWGILTQNYLDICSLLIELGVDINYGGLRLDFEKRAETPLFIAVTTDNELMTEFLINNGADPDLLSGNKWKTPREINPTLVNFYTNKIIDEKASKIIQVKYREHIKKQMIFSKQAEDELQTLLQKYSKTPALRKFLKAEQQIIKLQDLLKCEGEDCITKIEGMKEQLDSQGEIGVQEEDLDELQLRYETQIKEINDSLQQAMRSQDRDSIRRLTQERQQLSDELSKLQAGNKTVNRCAICQGKLRGRDIIIFECGHIYVEAVILKMFIIKLKNNLSKVQRNWGVLKH